MIYILFYKGKPLFFSPNREDLMNYCEFEEIEANISSVELVPTLEELEEDRKFLEELSTLLKKHKK